MTENIGKEKKNIRLQAYKKKTVMDNQEYLKRLWIYKYTLKINMVSELLKILKTFLCMHGLKISESD